jgi:hypothetical protein
VGAAGEDRGGEGKGVGDGLGRLGGGEKVWGMD